MREIFRIVILGILIFLPLQTGADDTDIIINEIHYHPESDFGLEEYVELYNRGTTAVDLSGWAFSEGIFFTFPDNTILGPDEYLLVAHNKQLVESLAPSAPVVGNYEGRLKDSNETIALFNKNGSVVESIQYGDRPPWPTTPDGKGASLQRISPFEDAHGPANWESGRVDSDNQWILVQQEGVANSKNLTVHLTINDKVLIDNISLVKTGSSKNLIQHHSFEDPTFGESWDVLGSHKASERLRVTGAPDGEWVLRVESQGERTGAHRDVVRQLIPKIEIGERYQLRLWVFPIGDRGDLSVNLGNDFVVNQSLDIDLAISPGSRNTVYSQNLPPYISNVQWSPHSPSPTTPVQIQARVQDSDEVSQMQVEWSTKQGRRWSSAQLEEMKLQSGTTRDGVWTVSMPAQNDRTLVRFRVFARDKEGNMRIYPSPTEARNTETYFHYADDVEAKIPVVFLYSGIRSDRQRDFRGETTFVYRPADEAGWDVYDHIIRTERISGWNIFFHKHFEFQNMSQINVVFETKQTNGLTDMRYSLAEFLTYNIYRSLGMPAQKVNHYRIFENDKLLGYYLMFEQPNKQFIGRNGIENSGNLYKIIWNFDRTLSRNNIIRQHEKKTNPSTGSEDIIETIQTLHSLRGQEQTVYIESHFAVNEFINYYVGCQLVEDWDGYFNNHFVYHDTENSGLWYVFAWDKDKTWGDSDAYRNILPFYDWYDFPIAFGAKSTEKSGKHNGTWWRPWGFFSGAILDNEPIRTRYFHRLGYVASERFTEDNWFPVINALEDRLEPEVRIRAKLKNENETDVLNLFHNNIESFRRQVINRREFIIQEVEKQIGPVSVSNWRDHVNKH